MNKMATRRLYRSRNGEILGVCKGIAEWRDYPVDTIRLIVILLAIFTAVGPVLIAYFIVGLVLPVNPYEEEDYTARMNSGKARRRREDRRGRTYYAKEGEDFEKTSSRTESSEEYERRQKENDWDNRFSNS